MFEQFLSIDFLSTSGASSIVYGTLKERSVPILQLFNPLVDVNYNKISKYGIPSGIGFVPIVLVFMGIIKRQNKRYWFILTSAFLVLFIISDLFPWDTFQNTLGIIQFPWRLYTYANLLFALASAYLVKDEKYNYKNILIIFIVVMISFICYSGGYYKKMLLGGTINKTNLVLENSIKVGSGEYLPTIYGDNEIMNYSDYLDNILKREKIKSNNIEKSNINIKYSYDVLEINYQNNLYSNTYIDVPRIYYKGYEAYDNKNNKLIVVQGELGVVRVYINDKEGSFIVKYVKTPIQIVSSIVSSSTSIILVFYYVNKKKIANNR